MRRVVLMGSLAIAGIVASVFVGILALGWPDHQYACEFEKIKPGTTRESIVLQLGEPSAVTKDCYVAQFVRFQNPSSWTQNGTTSYCAHWIGPGAFGQFYAIGFSSDNKVVGIAYGDS